MSTTRGASPNQSASASSSAVRPSMCSTLRPMSRSPVRLTIRRRCCGSKANTATSICSITVRSRAVASTAPSRCSCSVSARALTSMSAAPSGSSGLAVRPRMEKSSSRRAASRLARVCSGTTMRVRTADGEREERDEDECREGPLDLGGIVTRPEDRQRASPRLGGRRRRRGGRLVGRVAAAATRGDCSLVGHQPQDSPQSLYRSSLRYSALRDSPSARAAWLTLP